MTSARQRSAAIMDGIERARARGVRIGRPRISDAAWLARLDAAVQAVAGGWSIRRAANHWRISRNAIASRLPPPGV